MALSFLSRWLNYVKGSQDMPEPQDQILFVGTYTNLGAAGIYTCKLDGATGRVEMLSVADDAGPNPSFVTIHPNGQYLYSVAEVNSFKGDGTGGVTAYSIGEQGKLTKINEQSTGGTGPCHLVVDQTGKHLIIANYAGGSVAMLPLGDDGALGEACDFHQHIGGSGVIKERQLEPHAHSVTLTPDNRHVVVCDLGLDKVLVYRINHDAGKLELNESASTDSRPGEGPRHFAFHPDGDAAFAINEIGMTISAYDFDADSGDLEETHWVATVRPDTSYDNGNNSTADIHVSPDGRHVYGSNRGHNTLVIYGWDSYARMLYYIGHESTRGATPRNFAIDPSGTWVLAENQNGDTIHSFRRDADSGKLTHSGHMLSVTAPVCIQMMPA